MTTFQLLIVCATSLTLAGMAAAVLVHRVERHADQALDDVAPTRVGHRVTVHIKKPDEQVIFGVLAHEYTDQLVLLHAEYVTAAGAHPISAREHRIYTRDIAWVDVHALVTREDTSRTLAAAPAAGEGKA